MMRKSFLVLAIVSYVYLPICNIGGVSIGAPSKTISEEIKNDEQICATQSIFIKSRYAESCKTAESPKGNATLSETNTRQFLCLGLYDRISRLCYLGSTSKLGDTELPKDVATFDLSVKNLIPKDSDKFTEFCKNWKNSYPPRIKQIQPYVVQLETVLKRVPTCMKICVSLKLEYEPLCLLLASMDAISEKIHSESVKSEAERRIAKPIEGKLLSSGENGERADDALNRDGVEPKVAEIGTKKFEASTTIAKQSLEISRPMKKPEISVVASSSEKRPKGDESGDKKNSKIEEKKATTVEEGRARMGNKETIEKVASSEKPAKDPSKSTIDEHGNGKNSESMKNSQIDSPGGDEASPVREHSVEDHEKISPPVKEQTDQNTDIISERTQDEDPMGVVDPSEDANEIETPILPLLSEDIDESPAQTSEKRDYVPRLPGNPNNDDSHFFGYFTVFGVICIAGYVGYHNKQKILAMVLEGRRSRGGRGRRRPSTASYRKLDCTLEEAVTSQCNSNVTHVIY